MQLNDVLNDKKLLNILNNYQFENKNDSLTKQLSLDDQFVSWSKALSSNRFIIPVLGVQGAGKSSLLNALLMDDIVLPVDADETTCIPTEIIYTDEESNFADVIFKDGKKEKVALSEEGLSPYVNNVENFGNKKNVSYICVKKKSELLKNGVVLVDLPGMGSLTSNNIETTINYIKKSNGAIFLIRTVPPITQSEAIFIQSVWPILSKVFFIQNKWNDETKKEVEEGKKYSEIVLQKMAEESKLIKSDIIIDIVNVYKALSAKVKDNSDEFDKSGIQNIQEKIQNFVKDWKIEIIKNIKDSIVIIINNSLYFINKRIKSIEISKDELKKNIENERKDFDIEYKNKEKKANDCFIIIKNERMELRKKTQKSIRIAKENLRNDMRIIINSGVTDGEELQSAFNDNKKEQIDIVFEEIQPLIHNFIDTIQDSVSDISKVNLKTFNNEYDIGIETKVKFEGPLSKIIGGVGGIGGGLLGAEIGAKFGAVGGPIGIAIGGVIGGLIGLFVGKKTSSTVVKKRAESARKEVFSLIEQWNKEMEDHLLTQLEKLSSEIENRVIEWMKNIKIKFGKNEQVLLNTLSSSIDENEAKKKELIKESDTLEEYLSFIQGE